MFLALAQAAQTGALVTGDADLLALEDLPPGLGVVTPETYRASFPEA